MPAEVVLRNAEANALKGADSQSYYSGTGRSMPASEKGKGSKKKRGSIYAMLVILMLLTGGGVMIGSSHSLLGPALSYHITTSIVDTGWAYNSERYMNVASDLAAGKKAEGALGSLSKISNWMKTRLSSNSNFEVNGDSISWKGQSLNDGNLADLAKTNAEFRGDLEGTVGGRILSMQDNTNSNMYKTKFGVSGNAYKNFESTGNSTTDTANANKIANEQFEGKTTTRTTTTEDRTVKEYDEKGIETNNETLDKDLPRNTSESVNTSSMSANKIQEATAYINKVTGNVSKAVNYACTALRVGSVIATTIAGVATYSYARQFLANIMEPISKMMKGDGNESPINELYNRLTTPFADQVISDYTTAHATSNNLGDGPDCSQDCNTQGEIVISYDERHYENKAATESPNLEANLTGTAYDPTEAARHSLMSSLEATIATLAILGVTSMGCIKAQAGISAVELTMTVASAAISLLPGGQIVTVAGATSVIWNAFFRWAIALFAGATLNFTVYSFVQFLIPKLADTLFDNPTNDAKGIPEGERIISAAGIVGSQMSRRNNGGGLATKEQALAYNKLNKEVIAREAEVDRLNRSPFDTSSPNTFLGSLAYSFLPMTLSSGITPVKTLVSTTSSAIASLTNSASADGEGSSYLTTFGNYSYITEGFTESPEIAVDISGNPIIVNDLTMLDVPIDDPTYNEVINRYVDCNGTICTIESKSKLEHYIDFCVNRDSPFGVSDANILNALEYGSVILSNVVDLLNAVNYEENNEWATGKKCSSATNPDWESEFKYFALYVQDSRIAAQMGNTLPDENGLAYNNAVADRIATYDASRDDEGSYTKYVARVSGITEEEASGLIAVAEYYRYLDSYDPNTRLAFDGESTTYESSAEIATQFSTEEKTQPTPFFTQLATLYHQVIYADVRNRSYAA